MAQSHSGNGGAQTRRPTFNKIEGEYIERTDFEEGDWFVARIKWFDWEPDNPTHFRVKRSDDLLGDVLAEGTDGHTYKFYGDRATIECLSDDKRGKHRANLAARIKRID
jgi:hypothetical protein